jgi:transposase
MRDAGARAGGGEIDAVIGFGAEVRVFVATQPIDFRRGVHGLVALGAEGGGEPYSGDVFVFRSKRKDRLKLLVFDGSGLILATKWLEDGAFSWPPVRAGTMRVTGAQLAMLIEGLAEWSRVVPRVTKRPTIVA